MFVIVFITGIVILGTGFYYFDKILRFEYANYRAEWNSAGKAAGFYWTPPDSRFFSGSLQRTVQFLSWTFGREEWMNRHPEVLNWLRVMRGSVFMFWLLWLVFVVSGVQ